MLLNVKCDYGLSIDSPHSPSAKQRGAFNCWADECTHKETTVCLLWLSSKWVFVPSSPFDSSCLCVGQWYPFSGILFQLLHSGLNPKTQLRSLQRLDVRVEVTGSSWLYLFKQAEGEYGETVSWEKQIYSKMHVCTHVQMKTQAHINPNHPNVQRGTHDKWRANRGKTLVLLMLLILVRLLCWLSLTETQHHGQEISRRFNDPEAGGGPLT